MSNISPEEVISTFNNNNQIWPASDKWHYYTRKRIEKYLLTQQSLIDLSEDIANAGSSGESYNIPDHRTLHIDIIKQRIESKPKYLVANLEKIPINEANFDLLVCVGSTINYTNVQMVIKEFSRIIKMNGHLILEFECSNTFELMWSKKFNSNATIIKTFYRGEETTIWYYSERWIRRLLNEYGFEIKEVKRWHILSPLILKLTRNSQFSSYFSKLDILMERIPFVRKLCSNAIILAIKRN